MIGVKPVLVAVNEEIFPVPDAGIPMATFVFVHVYDAEGNPVEVKLVALIVAPSHTKIFAGTVTVAPGLEVTVTDEPTEQFALSTTTTVYVPAGMLLRTLVAVVFIVDPTNTPLELYQ
jgi:exosome complex RNA-binding protein Rrp42 (RNase PH superfamily)